MTIYKTSKKILKKYKLNIILFMLINSIIAIISILLPLITGTFIDKLILSPNISTIYSFCIILSGVSILNIIINYLMSVIGVSIKAKMSYELNKNVLFKIQEYPLLQINKIDPVYVNQRINADSNIVMSFVISFLENSLVNSITILMIFGYISTINIQLGIILLILCFSYLILFNIMKNKLKNTKNELKENSVKYYSKLQTQIKNIKFIKVNNLTNYIRIDLKNTFIQFLNVIKKNQKISFFFTSSETIIYLFAQIFLFYFGGKKIIDGSLTIGTFTILSGYFSKIITSIKYFVSITNDYIDANVSAERIQEYMNISTESHGNYEIKSIDKIDIKELYFGFKKELYNGLDYEFNKGTIYSIIGYNGKGKSTLVDLICGLYRDIFNGKILINNVDINKIDTHNLYKNKISYCLQHPILLDLTIKENITYGIEFDIDEFNQLVKGFKMDKLIKNNTLYKNLENNLSGGEKQKISIIRNLLKNSEMIILDEPTSNLDQDSKIFLLEYLKKIKQNKIIIIITHDIEVINHCDKLLEL